MSTTLAKRGQVAQKWYLIDAADKVVGRLAVQIANILRGKHRPDFTPHVDTGDFVVVINAEKVRFTGNKWDTQTYSSYSKYPGGLKTVGAKEMLARRPTVHSRVGRPPHGAAQPVGQRANDQAQDLRRRQTPAPGAEAD